MRYKKERKQTVLLFRPTDIKSHSNNHVKHRKGKKKGLQTLCTLAIESMGGGD